MLNKRGWSALEYLIMTVAVVAGLIGGATAIKGAVGNMVSTAVGTMNQQK